MDQARAINGLQSFHDIDRVAQRAIDKRRLGLLQPLAARDEGTYDDDCYGTGR